MIPEKTKRPKPHIWLKEYARIPGEYHWVVAWRHNTASPDYREMQAACEWAAKKNREREWQAMETECARLDLARANARGAL